MKQTPELGSVVVALIKLRDDKTVEGYRGFSRDFIRGEMAKFDSIVWFGDHKIRSTALDGKTVKWDVAEVFAVTSIDEFAEENLREHGQYVANKWNEWVAESEVLLLEDLLAG